MNKQEIHQNGIVGDYFTESGNQPRQAIIMLGGSEGGKSWSRIRKPIQALIQRGFNVLSLAYFKAPGLPDALQEIPLEYFEKAFDWLSAQAGIMPGEFALLGASKGSEAALLLASRFPQVRAVIAFSPSSVVWQGIPSNRFTLGVDLRSSWTWKGEGLPYVPFAQPIRKLDLLTLRLRELHERSLADHTFAEPAAIPVERIEGAVLFLSGRNDQLWPADTMGSSIMDRLQANDFSHPHQHLVFDGGHNTLVMNRAGWRQIFNFLEGCFASRGSSEPI